MNDETQPSASQRIDQKIAGLGDWRGDVLSRVRALIHKADPEVVETVKWVKPTNPSGVPIWEHDGIICTGETYKDKVKLTFAQGAKFPDPDGVFNGNDNGATRRSIDIFKGHKIDETAFTKLFRAAIEFNQTNLKKSAGKKK